MRIPTDLLLDWYRNALFPMAEPETGDIYLYSPDPRAILPLEEFHPSHTLLKTMRSRRFDVRWNTAFESVIRACAMRDETWISEDIIESYLALHAAGWAHSVEVWRGESLEGGLYGVAIGGAFFGESMFHHARDASKVALAALIDRMKTQGMTLLDVQYVTPHLQSLGAKEIPKSEYAILLSNAIDARVSLFP